MTELTDVEGADGNNEYIASGSKNILLTMTCNSATDANMNMKQRPVVLHAVTKTTKDISHTHTVTTANDLMNSSIDDATINTTAAVLTLRHQQTTSTDIATNKYHSNNHNSINKTNSNLCSNNGACKNAVQLNDTDFSNNNEIDHQINKSNNIFVPKIRWPDFLAITTLHIASIIAFILMFTTAKILTSLWAFFLIYTSGFGITAGAHRLWSHRAYKAKWPLRLILIFLFTITGQRDVYTWALDHRIHHKFSETDSDPHNAKRGFWFAHVGWLFLTPHPNVVEKRLEVDMSDLISDPIVMWQKRFYLPLFALLNVGMPTFVPWYFWNENLWLSLLIGFAFRFCFTLNIAFFVNSAAHMWGNRPYDKYISPVENLAVSIAALGEGWHNYHHVFPWDYKTSELGAYTFNISTAFIDFFAKIGWAYDRKKVSSTMIKRRAARSGDGTHCSTAFWGFGDRDIPHEDLNELNQMKE